MKYTSKGSNGVRYETRKEHYTLQADEVLRCGRYLTDEREIDENNNAIRKIRVRYDDRTYYVEMVNGNIITYDYI